jgi:hypothetical protein
MSLHRLAVLVVLLALPGLANGGIFGKKGTKVDPAQRVPELIGILKSSPDEHKRAEAADELRKYDVQKFPDIIPVLIEALHHDTRPGVRAEAAQSLGRIRPVSQAVGQALEQALARDSSMRVRLQARSSLLQYHMAGYRSRKKDSKDKTGEPPLAEPAKGDGPRLEGPAIPAPGPAIEPVKAKPQARPARLQPRPQATEATPPPTPDVKRLPLGPPLPASTAEPPTGPELK